MHGKYRNTSIDGIDIAVGHIFGDGSAAAFINLAHLTELPYHVLAVKGPSQISYDLRRSVTGTGLSACTGKLADSHTVIDAGIVALLAKQ